MDDEEFFKRRMTEYRRTLLLTWQKGSCVLSSNCIRKREESQKWSYFLPWE